MNKSYSAYLNLSVLFSFPSLFIVDFAIFFMSNLFCFVFFVFLIFLFGNEKQTKTGSISAKSEAQSVVADIPWDGALVGPSFDTGPESVVVSVGSTAYLACRVRQLGDRKVSAVSKMQIP